MTPTSCDPTGYHFDFLAYPRADLGGSGGGHYLPGYEEVKNSACVFQPRCVLLTGFLWLGLFQGILGILGECPSVLIPLHRLVQCGCRSEL